ncbi:MAG: FAD-dependent oxidoreductase [Mycobacteriales bacterium]|nr:FAD-dependent oxidoreductase [Mycobacteriales bacterium]
MVRVAVLGAGPTGLETALAATQRGWDAVVYEQAPTVAGHVRRWGHVRLFTPWSMNVSPRAASAVGVPADGECPTGADYAEHLDRVAALLPDVRLSTQVVSIAREGLLKNEEIGSDVRAGRRFRLLLDGPSGEVVEHADVVIDTTGTWSNPNPLGHGGIPAPGERSLADRIVREIPAVDATWADREVLLVGAGNSAQTVARDLAAVGARVTWAVRRATPTWGAVEGDVLPDRVELVASSRRIAAGEVPGARVVTGVVVESLRDHDGRTAVTLLSLADSSTEEVVVDVVVSMTGAVGDSSLYRQLQVHECYATEGPMSLAATLLGSEGGDCLTQVSAGVDALRNPEPRFFVLGSKSYGRNNTFLLRVGWEQVEEVFTALDAELLAPV